MNNVERLRRPKTSEERATEQHNIQLITQYFGSELAETKEMVEKTPELLLNRPELVDVLGALQAGFENPAYAVGMFTAVCLVVANFPAIAEKLAETAGYRYLRNQLQNDPEQMFAALKSQMPAHKM